VLCRVANIEIMFPAERSISLMNQYGKDCSDVVQVPKMIQRLTLQIIESMKDLKLSPASFTVDLFPNELPDFLVLQHVLESQKT
jgi:hypothetical protein